MIEAITQTVAVGNRLDAGDLPTTTPAVVRGHATYASSAQGGLFVFSTEAGEAPSDGETYDINNAGITPLHSLVGNMGDCTAVDLYLGPPASMTKVASLTLGVAPVGGHELFWDLRAYRFLRTWAIGVTDSGGGVTLARVVTLIRET